jgi:hypothetical protein
MIENLNELMAGNGFADWLAGITKTPAPGGRYECAVDDCTWSVDVPSATVVVGQEGDRLQLSGVDPASLEAALAAHLDTHPAVDYLRTIQRLNSEVARLRAQAS